MTSSNSGFDDHPDLGSGPDLSALLSQIGQVSQNLQAAQQSAASEVVEGRAGGGAVVVEATGSLDFQRVTIDPSVVDPADVELLQDLVLAAVRDAVERAHDLQSNALGGLDFGGLLGP
jgi:DNA-binding YbaB/EbfC family protein